MNGTARGAEAVRAIVVKARELYEFQDFSFTGDFGDNGFLEIYDASVLGEPMKVVVTVTRNAAGQAQELAVLHRPRNTLLLFSREMNKKFAGTPSPSTSSPTSPETTIPGGKPYCPAQAPPLGPSGSVGCEATANSVRSSNHGTLEPCWR